MGVVYPAMHRDLSPDEHPEAYARKVLVNLTRDHWRRKARRGTEEEFDERTPHAAARDVADTVVDRDALRRALGELPRRQREVMVLLFFADLSLSVADTAAALGVSEGTVKTQTSRAVTRLRQALGEKVHEH